MAIEFTCESCLAVLRTADGNAALPALCPACGDSLHVPDATRWFADRRFDRDDRRNDDRRNDDRVQANGRGPTLEIVVCPSCGMRNVPEARDCRACGEPLASAADDAVTEELAAEASGPFGLDNLLGTSWRLFRQEFGPCLLGTVVSDLAVVGGVIAAAIPLLLTFPLFALGVLPHPKFVILPYVALVVVIVFAYAQVGYTLYIEHVVRERRGNLALLFRGSRFVPRMIAVDLVFWLIVGLGLLAFVIPGIVLYTVFWPASFILVEEDCGVFEALGRARRRTRGHRATLFVVSLVSMLVWLISSAALAGLGSLAASPFYAILSVVTYLHLTGKFGKERDPWVEEYEQDPIVGDRSPRVDRRSDVLEPDPV